MAEKNLRKKWFAENKKLHLFVSNVAGYKRCGVFIFEPVIFQKDAFGLYHWRRNLRSQHRFLWVYAFRKIWFNSALDWKDTAWDVHRVVGGGTFQTANFCLGTTWGTHIRCCNKWTWLHFNEGANFVRHESSKEKGKNYSKPDWLEKTKYPNFGPQMKSLFQILFHIISGKSSHDSMYLKNIIGWNEPVYKRKKPYLFLNFSRMQCSRVRDSTL